MREVLDLSSAQGFVISLAGCDLDRQFGRWDPDPFDPEPEGPVFDYTVEQLEPYLDLLPPKEADFLEMTLFLKKTQVQVAEIFGYTQVNVSYRLRRAITRIKWLASVDYLSFTEEGIREDLVRLFPTLSPCAVKPHTDDCRVCHGAGEILIDIEILVRMHRTACQSITASDLAMTQGRVRHHFLLAAKRLQSASPKYAPYAKLFGGMIKNWNMLVETETGRRHDPEFTVG